MSLKAILDELRAWRSRPSQRERISSRPRDTEKLDPTPVAIPVGYETPPTMTELIQQYVRLEVSQAAEADGLGSFEQEDDFELDEHDPLPMEMYEVNEYTMEDDPEMPATADADGPEGVALVDSTKAAPPAVDPLPTPGEKPADPK